MFQINKIILGACGFVCVRSHCGSSIALPQAATSLACSSCRTKVAMKPKSGDGRNGSYVRTRSRDVPACSADLRGACASGFKCQPPPPPLPPPWTPAEEDAIRMLYTTFIPHRPLTPEQLHLAWSAPSNNYFATVQRQWPKVKPTFEYQHEMKQPEHQDQHLKQPKHQPEHQQPEVKPTFEYQPEMKQPEHQHLKQPGEQTFTEQPRSLIRCHTPHCQYLVNPNVDFGSFCCCKCYYRFEAGASCKKQKHGMFCIRAEALAAVQRGHYVHPVWYRQCQQQRAAAAAAASPIAFAPVQ